MRRVFAGIGIAGGVVGGLALGAITIGFGPIGIVGGSIAAIMTSTVLGAAGGLAGAIVLVVNYYL